MTTKGWIIFITIVALSIGGAIFMSRQGKEDLVVNVETNAIQQASANSGDIADHAYGDGDKVTLIEYGDYQCPGCGSSAPTIKQVVEKYKDKLTFVFRNKLMPYHQNARAAASFAEAAGLQGKYWEMHATLFENQNSWVNLSASDERTKYFASLIKEIGGDSDKALAAIESDEIAKKIDFDEALSDKHGVTGTPSFFLNGKNVGEIYALDGEIAPRGTTNSTGDVAQPIWTSVEDFEKFAIQPALKDAGIQ